MNQKNEPISKEEKEIKQENKAENKNNQEQNKEPLNKPEYKRKNKGIFPLSLLEDMLKEINVVPSLIDLVLKVKARTLKNINLYYSNYYEDIEKYVQQFYSSVWTLMCQCQINDNYSKLMKELLDFFKCAFQMGRINNLAIEQLNQIFENIN